MKHYNSAIKRLVMSAVALIVVSFCMNAANPLVGEWRQTVVEESVRSVVTYDFRADGTMTQQVHMSSSSYPRMKMETFGKCKYTFSNGVITFRFTANDISIPVLEIEGVDKAVLDGAIQQMKASQATQSKITDVSIVGNKLTGRYNGNTIELIRVEK